MIADILIALGSTGVILLTPLRFLIYTALRV